MHSWSCLLNHRIPFEANNFFGWILLQGRTRHLTLLAVIRHFCQNPHLMAWAKSRVSTQIWIWHLSLLPTSHVRRPSHAGFFARISLKNFWFVDFISFSISPVISTRKSGNVICNMCRLVSHCYLFFIFIFNKISF